MITIYKNIFAKEPYYISVTDALNRIKNGKSKELVESVRSEKDKEKRNEIKKKLPSVCFSGEFKERKDEYLIKHSGYIVLDFDHVDIQKTKAKVIENEYTNAVWVSPSGDGLKVLVKIADGSKHRLHFQALEEVYKGIDKSGINVSRVCYESYDKDIYINENSKVFDKTKEIERVLEVTNKDEYSTFKNIITWLDNSGDYFSSGSRNQFIFKLASACCRFGIIESACVSYVDYEILKGDSSFTISEAKNCIRSAYKSNYGQFGSAEFEDKQLVEKVTRKTIIIEEELKQEKSEHIIYGEDVKESALRIYEHGYESAKTTYIPELDEFFKFKRSEITLLTGIGNYGKSTFLKYLLLLQVLNDNEKIAIYTPEDCPAHEFYHDLTETFFAQDCSPRNENRPSKMEYEEIYDMISKHFFFIYPSSIDPTPENIKACFLRLKTIEGVSFCVIDPFNQLMNDYSKVGGRDDKYLEPILADFSRFNQEINNYFIIVAHPKTMHKDSTGNYPCPDVYDLAGGAMWNNKMDNILVYHLPIRQTDPSSTLCEFHSKKIRRRKIVGNVGSFTFEYVPRKRRFTFNGTDYMNKFYSVFEPKQYREIENINLRIEIDGTHVFDNPQIESEVPF